MENKSGLVKAGNYIIQLIVVCDHVVSTMLFEVNVRISFVKWGLKLNIFLEKTLFAV